MAKQKLKWSDVEEIVYLLIDKHPHINPMKLDMDAIQKYVTDLPGFSESSQKPELNALEFIQNRWFEERSEMEDELGPMEEDEDENDTHEEIEKEDLSTEDEDEEEFDEFNEEDEEEEEENY